MKTIIQVSRSHGKSYATKNKQIWFKFLGRSHYAFSFADMDEAEVKRHVVELARLAGASVYIADYTGVIEKWEGGAWLPVTDDRKRQA